MSDPEVPQPERPKDVNDVLDSANEGLDAAAAAGADVPAGDNAAIRDNAAGRSDAASSAAVADSANTHAANADAANTDAATERSVAPIDPDLAAFEAAERDHPGTFTAPAERRDSAYGAEATEVIAAPAATIDETPTVADTAYSSRADAETTIVPSEPAYGAAAPAQPQPIFVQAPEPPQDRGNRGTAGAIGLLATLAFAVLYLGAALGLGALAGDVDGSNIGQAALAPLQTAGYWVPVAVFFLGFWLLGAIINRGRWGLWVVFGIIVGAIAYGGHLLGQLFQAQFWTLTASEGAELIGGQLLAPLAIVAFVFARELTIWFGAWVARSGARKTELNLEAQREYERTLEAGPTLSR